MTSDELRRSRRIDFESTKAVVLRNAETVVPALLPDGRREGFEWVCRNPYRSDRRLGSFKVNLTTGKWADFATGDRGGDLVALAAFVAGTSQREAAIKLAESLGFSPWEGTR